MRRVHLVAGGLAVSAGMFANAPQPPAAPPHRAPSVTPEFARIPLSFERNDGQAPEDVRFVARTGAATVFIRPADATIACGDSAVSMRLDGARGDAPVAGEDELPGKVNWFLGRDPAQWRAGIPTFGRVRCSGVWPGIDLCWRGSGKGAEYDFVVEPGADPSDIALSFDGARDVSIETGSGDLLVAMDGGTLRQGRPVVWQEEAGGRRREIAGEFALLGGGRVGFRLDGYDPSQTLVVDPPISFVATFMASFEDRLTSMVLDAAGNAYIAGSALSAGPTGPFYRGLPKPAQANAVVTKVDRSGRFVHWSTYFGGEWGDVAHALAVGPAGDVHVCGHTRSPDFPVTAGAYDSAFDEAANDRPGDAFVAKLTPQGAISWATLWGETGDDDARAIAVKPDGRVVVVGATSSLVVAPTQSPFQRIPGSDGADAFLAWFSPDGTAMEGMTYLGGAYYDFATSLVLDEDGNVLVTGGTGSPEIANTSPVRPWSGYYDLFVAKFASADELVWFTYLGGTGSEPGYFASLARDAYGWLYLASTSDSTDFPTTNGVVQRGNAGGTSDGVIARLDSQGVLDWATYLGGEGDEYPVVLAVDPTSQAVVVAGATDSRQFPLVDPAQADIGGGVDVFAARISPLGRSLEFSTYFGGDGPDYCESVGVTPDGSIWLAGTMTEATLDTPLAEQSVVGNYYRQASFVVRYGADAPVRSGTISLRTTKGSLVDRPDDDWRDSFRASGTFTPPAGPFDPKGKTAVIAIGDPSDLQSFGLAPYSMTSNGRGKFTWTTSVRFRGQRIKLTLDARRGTFSLAIDRFDFTAPATGPIAISLMIAGDDGIDQREWRRTGPGRARFRDRSGRR